MIAIQQWRMAIGCFHPCGFKAGCTNDFANGKFSFRGKMSFILVISIISLLLVMAGDVEFNPGPLVNLRVRGWQGGWTTTQYHLHEWCGLEPGEMVVH